MKRLALLLSTFGVMVQAELTLVEQGGSGYAIVRPAEATPSQVYAAEELRDFVARMTGVELPIRTDAEPLPERAILLGVTRHTAAVLGGEVDLARLGDDGFRIKSCPPHLVIAGSGVRGTLYGVYELLERYGGCRWYASFHSVIPKRESLTVPADLDDTQVPAFVMREPFWFDMFQGDFAARSRANGNQMRVTEKHGGKIRFGAGLFVHTFYRLMPPDEFFADHPEYFSEINGKRVADHAQLCLSNPEVRRICTERLLEHIRRDPTAKLYSLSQNDWRGYCTCAECKALDEREGTPTASVIHFVNQVAAEVEKEFPDAWIETLAYQYTRTPPKTIRPRANVVPRLCTIECDFSLPLDRSPHPQNTRFVEEIKGWSAETDKLYIWDYTTNFAHYLGPHPNFACLQGNVQFFRDNHVVGLFEQGAYQGRHAEFAELRAWVLAKLLWNPDQNVEALYDDFFPGYYGKAAPLVRQYWAELQTFVADPEIMLNIWTGPQAKYYPEGFFARSLELWRQAEALVADDPAYSYNVRMGALPVYYSLLQLRGEPPVAYEFDGARFAPSGADPEYAALAREFLARFREAKDIRISENGESHENFLTKLRSQAEGFATTPFGGGGYEANAVAELGGRICRLVRNGGPNLLEPRFGMDAVQGQRDYTQPGTLGYAVKALAANQVEASHTWRRQLRHTSRADLTADGLAVTHDFASLRAAEQSISPVLRAAFDLGNSSAVCILSEAGGWQTVVVGEDETSRFANVPSVVPGQKLVLASPVTRRAVRVRLPANPLDRVQVLCDARNGRVVLLAVLSAAELPGSGTASATWHVAEVPVPDGLPEVEVPTAHRADRIAVEDFRLGIGRRGEWGDYVDDPLAEDGTALKLFNTHYEWCTQWRIDPTLFDPGTTYRVRMRIRVEKTGQAEGEAFWAGVYDTVRKTGFGQVQPKVGEVADGYQWYEVATWIPEASQYIWIGPGRFEKDQVAANPAIQAVYVDRFELVRVRE
ncbi:MAG: DUF4838 domain-containing protein [Lentisphaeria bacterium]|jgi:hypothetical protein|nr:DUF4838 domain-containing protein [Lentisphaeria bacterium]